MDLEHGFGLFALGMILTVLGFGIAFYFGSKQTKPEPELTEVEKLKIYTMLKKIKKSEYQDYADCIRSDQISAAGVLDLMKDKSFYKWYKKKYL
jgi:hypothetical protein